MIFSSKAIRDLVTYDGDVCLRCRGLVPREGVHYVPDDGSLCECDILSDVVQHNEPNRILVAFRADGLFSDVTTRALIWRVALDYLDTFGGFVGWDDPAHHQHIFTLATAHEAAHARRVLARLATIGES